jgi:hypothetical protein
MNRLKIPVFLVFWIIFVDTAVAADLVPDLRVAINGRSYPIGVQAVGSASVGVPIWGRTDTWRYGYARISLNAATSVVVNRVGLEAQFFPISILGIAAGFDSGVRNFVPRFLDCSAYECEGRVDRTYLRAQFLAAAKGVILLLNARSEVLHSYRSGRPFFDEMTLLRGRNHGESILSLNPVLLYRFDPVWSAGGVWFYSRALDSGGAAHLAGPVISYSEQTGFNLTAGIGVNQSVLVHPAMAFFFSAQWNLEPSLQVNDLPLRTRTYSSLF